MARDSRSIGERLQSFDDHARGSADIPENQPGNKEKAEGSRENVKDGGISNRHMGEEQRRQQNVPPRGQSKERGYA